MSDPQAVWAAGTEHKRTLLRSIWPEMYQAFAGTASAEAVTRNIPCAIYACSLIRPKPLAVARLTRNGVVACRKHVDQMADRPGGWPLKREDGPPS